ncbi:MAG: sulfatase-like hydrolase/transferase [Candidatus Eremiobacterota bacterium]
MQRGTFWLLAPSLALFLGLNFLSHFDVLFRRMAWNHVLCNATVVLAVGVCATLCLSLALAGLERLLGSWAGQPSTFLCFLLFYSVNLMYLKLRLIAWVRPLKEGTRLVLTGIALLGVVLLYWLLRQRVAALKAGGATLSVRPLTVWVLIALAVGWLAGRADSGGLPEPGRKPSILMVTYDGLAAQDMSLYGFKLPTTPGLDRLASSAYVFEAVHANSNSTPLAIPCFQGYYPRVVNGEPTSGALGPTLLEVLRGQGYRTCLISFHNSRFFSLKGVDEERVIRSFELTPLFRALNRVWRREQLEWLSSIATEEWMYYNPFDPRIQDEYHLFWEREHHPSELMLEQAAEMLERHPAGLLVWVHTWVPHYPYRPAKPYRGRFGGPDSLPGPRYTNGPYSPKFKPLVDRLRLAYDEYILQGDAFLEVALTRLRERGVLDRIYLVVSSDHGQSFQDGYLGHWGRRASEPLLHVPLLLRVPDQKGGARLATPAQQLDVAPTLLELLGLPIPPEMPGESLAPYLDEPSRLSPRPKVCLTTGVQLGFGGQVAVYQEAFKLVFTSTDPDRATLLDLRTGQDVTAEHPDRVAKMLAAYLGLKEGGMLP